MKPSELYLCCNNVHSKDNVIIHLDLDKTVTLREYITLVRWDIDAEKDVLFFQINDDKMEVWLYARAH